MKKEMNTIKFEIYPSEESNDHQVRIIIDNSDFLGNDHLGIDPPSFFAQRNLFEAGELLIGRCTCGCEGCDDYSVNVFLQEDTIIWSNSNGLTLEFNKSEYDNAISTAKKDYSWEDNNRRVERYVFDLLRRTKTKDEYTFDWASARIKENFITLSYSRHNEQRLVRDQKLFEIEWDGKSVESGVVSAEKFVETLN